MIGLPHLWRPANPAARHFLRPGPGAVTLAAELCVDGVRLGAGTVAEPLSSPMTFIPRAEHVCKRVARQMRLVQALMQAWHAFDRASGLSSRVAPAMPILFFGDVDAYRISPLRVLTVGLNPSLHEFPADEPFRRFALAEGAREQEPSRCLDAMSAYYRSDPYRGWFSAFEPLLKGLGASYYEGRASTALHTDLCSPVATNPMWNGLDKADRVVLEADGRPLWHLLLKELRPQIVALSVAKGHLQHIEFVPTTEWRLVHAFVRTASGRPRSRPYEIRARWFGVGGQRSLFIFGGAAQKPFGLLANSQKQRAGAILLKAYQDGR